VDPWLFRQAEALAASRLGFYADEQLLQHLRDFLAKHGSLTERQISADPDMPSSEVYHMRFWRASRSVPADWIPTREELLPL
jgi:hypothetical protein